MRLAPPTALACAALALALAACGSSKSSTPRSDAAPPARDGSTAKDGGALDRGADASSGADGGVKTSNVGQPCSAATAAKDCQPGSPTCVEGACTIACTPDDPESNLANEDTCPGAASGKELCAKVPAPGGTQHYCALTCTPGDTANPCPAGSKTACTPRSADYSGTLDVAVCWDSACERDTDCPVTLDKKCDPLRGDADCDQAAGEACVDDGDGGGLCAVAGKCNLTNGLCQTHAQGRAAAKIGDPCKSDKDCGNDHRCDLEYNDGGVTYVRNGYCTKGGCTFVKTLPSAACPADSTCNRGYGGGVCQRSCKLGDASTCRGHTGDKLGDYECYDWSKLQLGNVKLSDGPVCDVAGYTPCDFFAGGDDDCSSLGDATNTTKMSCRDPKTGTTLTDAYDPNGYCLDDTASGPK